MVAEFFENQPICTKFDSPHDTDLSVTPTNTPTTPPVDIPVRTVFQDDLDVTKFDFAPICDVDKPELSPISGSFDYDFSDVESPLTVSNAKNQIRFFAGDAIADSNKARTNSSTNELPLTELNLALFTSELETKISCKMSTNELPLSDIRFDSKSCKLSKQNTVDSQNDDTSMEVNWDTDIKEIDEKPKHLNETRQRSFSDPNILNGEWINCSEKYFLLKKYNESLAREDLLNSSNLSPPVDSPCLPYSFYPEHAPDATCLLCSHRTPSTLLSFFTSSPRRLGASRSLSHPAPCVTPCMSDSECGQTVKRHRHSIAGQMSYFKMLGFGCGGPIGLKKLVGNSTNSLFSTAVISGSSSAPNLRDMISNTSSATAIEGFGGVPPIRPLETLHNALSLKQIDAFLDRMTSAPLFRTPSSTPPRHPSTPLPTPTNGSNGSIVAVNCLTSTKSQPLRLQSPSNSFGWSGPRACYQVVGPRLRAFPRAIRKGVVVNCGQLHQDIPDCSGLDQDLGSVGILLDSIDKDISGSMEFSEYYASIHKPQGGESGDVTPVSGSSELEFNTDNATAGSSSTADLDLTVIEDIETAEDPMLMDPNETITNARLNALSNIFNPSTALTDNNLFQTSISPKVISPLNPNVNICTNVLHSPTTDGYILKHVENVERVQPSTSRIINEFDRKDLKNIIRKSSQSFEKDIPSLNVNISGLGSDKWSTTKEKFLESKNYGKTDNIDFGKNLNLNVEKKVEKDNELMKAKSPGTVMVRESFIEPPRISRVSRSFHGKSPGGKTHLDAANILRRASDGESLPDKHSTAQEGQNGAKPKSSSERTRSSKKPPFVTQLSQPCGTSLMSIASQPRKTSLSEAAPKAPRFITTRVDEAEHAASMGLTFVPRVNSDLQGSVGQTSLASDSEATSAFHLSRSNSEKNRTSTCSDSNDSSARITRSNADRSSVTHGFSVDKKS
ncbi:hypothetical protein NQ318_010259 [Aromia moschata]|uniref:Uncharacterized protein n=1 Tax=Aromia moschata TaxID=1265417 RepID=A0AAV8YJK0_9CUCU|nr:hypothetical protein NQ318_010259 [Aromia moschata]